MYPEKDYLFVIYGGGSDLIKHVYDRYNKSYFIPIIKKTKASFSIGHAISIDDFNFLSALKKEISNNSKNKLIIYINAATFQLEKLFVSHSDDELINITDTGISMQLKIARTVISQMLNNKCGRLINISSFRSKTPANGTSVYSSIKSFNETLFHSFGLEYGRFDITSNSISLGFADTKLLKNLDKFTITNYRNHIVKEYFLPPNEFIHSIDYIIQSKYLNCATIDLDGGLKKL
tara:strand:- start:384 stop:1085 length:702 start_codon:yes stop_codon:yes gene_type:complete